VLLPDKIAPLDPDEFVAAYEYAGMVSHYEFLEEVPGIGKPLFTTHEGAVALTNVPENRFGLAIVRHFRVQQEKAQAFLWRFFALHPLFEDPRMASYTRGTGDDREINTAVFEVAAAHPLTKEYAFDSDSFFAAVSDVVARKEET
jgi:hypothetical protein